MNIGALARLAGSLTDHYDVRRQLTMQLMNIPFGITDWAGTRHRVQAGQPLGTSR